MDTSSFERLSEDGVGKWTYQPEPVHLHCQITERETGSQNGNFHHIQFLCLVKIEPILHRKDSVGSEQIQLIPDYYACGCRDPIIWLM